MPWQLRTTLSRRWTRVAALDLTSGGSRQFDVIIDDGLHTWSGQQRTLTNLWPLLRPGGYYFIEDVVWGDLAKHAAAGAWNPLVDSTSPEALAILREGGAYSISLDAFWKRLSKHRFSTIIAMQRPHANWPRLQNDDKGVLLPTPRSQQLAHAKPAARR